jgi:hypothetical protein
LLRTNIPTLPPRKSIEDLMTDFSKKYSKI